MIKYESYFNCTLIFFIILQPYFFEGFPPNFSSNSTSYTRIVCHWLYRSFLVITQCVKLDPVYATSISTLKPRKRNYFVMSWMTSKEILEHFLPNYNTQTQWFPYVKMGNMWEWEILLTLVTCICMRGVKFQVYRYIINRVFSPQIIFFYFKILKLKLISIKWSLNSLRLVLYVIWMLSTDNLINF